MILKRREMIQVLQAFRRKGDGIPTQMTLTFNRIKDTFLVTGRVEVMQIMII